ncbi:MULTISPECIES: ABC transporter substrate-binding protein [Salinibaculum]|uniref:ABC transporter substrate-binding protein n=1 Tax=Salinibaculum TaxID=2732368 RepID=UPI0030D4728A
MPLDLSIAVGNRDVNRALLSGEVEPDGIDATVVSEYPPRRNRWFFEYGDYDVAEVSLASYLAARASDEEYSCTALSVFPARRFRHSFLWKHTDAPVDDPADLAGKRVGIQTWHSTPGVWIRGIAKEHYGLDLEAVTWYQRETSVPTAIPPRFDVQPLPRDQSDDTVADPSAYREMFRAGDLDAAMDPVSSMFNAVVESEDLDFVFDDPVAEERQYYRETAIFPIMHVVVVRDEVLADHSWVATNLVEAFTAALDRRRELNRHVKTNTSIVWAHHQLAEQRALLDPDVWNYGLTDSNVRTWKRSCSVS